jgi:hypothetical protein
MTRSRRIASTFVLGLALLIGQQAAALHDLGHAREQLSQKKDARHVPSFCDHCFACAELSGAVTASVPSVPLVPADPEALVASLDAGEACAPRLAFRSRAPPVLL